MPVSEALDAVHRSGRSPSCPSPGENPRSTPTSTRSSITLVAEKYFVYCCTNALLLPRMLDKIPPSKYFCWVIHMDGMEDKHDESVARQGVFKRAIEGIRMAIDRGYRVCTNTTVFRNSDVEDLREMFRYVSDLGVEGSMISPGYDFEDAPDQDLFLTPSGIPATCSGTCSTPTRMEGNAFLQQSPLPQFPPRRPGIPVHRVVQSNLHGYGLAQTLLSLGG